MTGTQSKSKKRDLLFILTTWGVMLLVSLLPDILFKEIGGSLPMWVYWVKIGLLFALLAVCLLWKRMRLLWLFSAVLLAVYLLEWGVARFYQSINYSGWFSGAKTFIKDVGMVQIPRATVGVLLVVVLLALTGSFKRFFLVSGNLQAKAEPIPLILTRPPRWNFLAPAIAGAMVLGLIVFSLAFGSPLKSAAWRGLLPLVPFILLFAASNAFGEEMLYRAPWIAALENPVGDMHALLITAVYFGLAHFYGVPYGILGVVMAFIPGWLMGKAIRETRGFFWAWFIHFCMDTVIFFFMAMGSLTPGG